jgi:hypothetical protein
MTQSKVLLLFAISFGLVTSLPFASAEIREAKSMGEIVPLIHQNTVLVFDLDNTVIEAAQTLGSDQFFEYLVKKARSTGLQGEAAIAWALEHASKVQPLSPVRAVEPETPAMISSLQALGIPTVALTARPIEWANDTVLQLDSLGISFTRSPLYRGDLPFGPGGLGRNRKGVLFMPKGGDKGRYLRAFLEASGIQAEQLIFIDDKLRNVQSVDAAFGLQSALPHIEFRYGAADAKVHQFNPDLAEFEWNYFMDHSVFITDEEARAMMGTCGESTIPANTSSEGFRPSSRCASMIRRYSSADRVGLRSNVS